MSMRPELTPLDRRVLALLRPISASRCSNVHHELRRGRSYEAYRNVTELDVRLILRGLEQFGLAEGRRGWWRRTVRGDQELAA